MGTDEQMGAGSLKFVIQGTPECGNGVQPNFCRCDADNAEMQKIASLNFCTPECGNAEMQKIASLNFCTPECGNGAKRDFHRCGAEKRIMQKTA